MKFSGQASCLLLLCVAVSTTLGAVSEEEKEKILKGLEAGKEFTEVLGSKGMTESLRKMTEIIGPWVDGIGIFSSVLGMFLPEENEMLEEMKKGFKEVNERLDAINEGLAEVKEAIDWAVVKVNFQGIEQDIRMMDEKLKEVVQAPTPEHGKDEYIRVYEDQYDEAGILLWDSIVNDDQVFYENIVKAGMKYTKYDRIKMNDFMKGLIALTMKSADVEVSYEKFKEQDRGMVSIWKTRLMDVQQALVKADGVLEESWAEFFRGEVDELAKELEGVPQAVFRDAVYSFLTEKYYWMKWFVLVYDPVLGGDKHGVWYFPSYGYSRFRFHGRNFLIACSGLDWPFDVNAAMATVRKDIECPYSQSKCSDTSSFTIMEVCPKHGQAAAAIRPDRSSWAVSGPEGRMAWGLMNLRKGTWYRPHHMFQFG